MQIDSNNEQPIHKDEIDLLFRIIDDNNSGKIDFMEFMVKTSKPHFFFILPSILEVLAVEQEGNRKGIMDEDIQALWF